MALGVGVVVLLACAESTGPPTPPQDPVETPETGPTLHMLRWDPLVSLEFAAIPGGDTGVLHSPVLVPPLDRPEVSFWATVGTATSMRINYRAQDGTWLPYLDFVLNRNSLLAWPDGESFASGERVLVTVRVDTVNLRVYIGPIGLMFNPQEPAQLTLWYTGADRDLNGDGKIDSLDDTIERERLQVWTQVNAFDPWIELDAAQSIEDKQFIANLDDAASYSGYAVSYSGYAVSY